MDNKKFYGCADASKLGEILKTFQMWMQEVDHVANRRNALIKGSKKI